MANTIPDQGPRQTTTGESTLGKQQTPQTANQNKSPLMDQAEAIATSAEEKIKAAIEQGQEVRERALAAVEKKQSQLGDSIRDVSGVLRSSGRKLDDDNESVASLLNVASDQVDRFASYVDTASPRSVASDLRHFARDRPAWVIGGGFLAGLALGRFLKSSARVVADDGPAIRWREEYPPSRAYRDEYRAASDLGQPRAQSTHTSNPGETP